MSPINTVLLILAGIGLRDGIYNTNVSLLRTQIWKNFLEKSTTLDPQPVYNEVFFSFAVQHTLATIAFTGVGILCMVNPPPVAIIQATFLHHFIWEISMFIRDYKYYEPGFRKLHWAKQGMMISVGMLWIALGILQKLAGLGGFIVLTFLGSTITASISNFVRMFMNEDKYSYCIVETVLFMTCRIWRWTIGVYAVWLVFIYEHPEAECNMFDIIFVGICGAGFEALECLIQSRRLWLLWKKHIKQPTDKKKEEEEKETDDDYADDGDIESSPAATPEVSPNPSPTYEKLAAEEDDDDDNNNNNNNNRLQESYLESENWREHLTIQEQEAMGKEDHEVESSPATTTPFPQEVSSSPSYEETIETIITDNSRQQETNSRPEHLTLLIIDDSHREPQEQVQVKREEDLIIEEGRQPESQLEPEQQNLTQAIIIDHPSQEQVMKNKEEDAITDEGRQQESYLEPENLTQALLDDSHLGPPGQVETMDSEDNDEESSPPAASASFLKEVLPATSSNHYMLIGESTAQQKHHSESEDLTQGLMDLTQGLINMTQKLIDDRPSEVLP